MWIFCSNLAFLSCVTMQPHIMRTRTDIKRWPSTKSQHIFHSLQCRFVYLIWAGHAKETIKMITNMVVMHDDGNYKLVFCVYYPSITHGHPQHSRERFSMLRELSEASDGAVLSSYNLSSHRGWAIACFSITFHHLCHFCHLKDRHLSTNVHNFRHCRLLFLIGDMCLLSFACWF